MNRKNILATLVLLAALPMLLLVQACNEKDDNTTVDGIPNVAVTAFSLKKDNKVSGLDSVYFAIDLEHGVIFNADSLRPGTKIDKVVPSITFSGTVDKAIITMTGGKTRTGEVDYKKSPNDSIDFTGDVTLTLGADDGRIEKVYRIKVNVHNVNPDSYSWQELESMHLPSRLGNPVAQKTVSQGSRAVTLIAENDGSYTLSHSSDIASGSWVKSEISLPFRPVVSTLTATGESLWILAEDGRLFRSDNMATFSDTGKVWTSLTGAYLNTVVGTESVNGKTVFTQYPQLDINPVEAPSSFPLTGTTNMVTLSNKWTSSPVALFVGGRCADGKLSDKTWAFDGAEWIVLSQGGIPALEGASLIPYYNYRPSAAGNSMIEYNVWLVLGGKTNYGTFNRTVYISYDNGVNWQQGSSSMQLPDAVPSMTGSDNIVFSSEHSANISDAWKKPPMRLPYEVDGDNIVWDCPYIYLIGGYNPEGKLYDTIWRGVLLRLTFTPII